jgi:hypothetical protein
MVLEMMAWSSCMTAVELASEANAEVAVRRKRMLI